MRAGRTWHILLFATLTLVAGCAAREAARAPEAASAAPPPPPEEAPESVIAGGRAGAVDRSRIVDGFGVAEPLTEQEAMRRVAEGRASPRTGAAGVDDDALSFDAPELAPAPAAPLATEALSMGEDSADEVADRAREVTKRSSARRAEAERRPAKARTKALAEVSGGAVEVPPDPQAPGKDRRQVGAARGPAVGALQGGLVRSADAFAPARLLVRDARGGQTALAARAVRLVAHLQGARARTVLDLVFDNPSDQRLEGTFQIELPPDATVAGFSVFDGAPPRSALELAARGQALLPRLPAGFVAPGARDRLAPANARAAKWRGRKDATLVEDTTARAAHEAAVAAGRPGAAMGWGGGQTFTARVFPVEPGRLKRVVVVYEAPLPVSAGSARYDMPTAPSGTRAQATIFVDDAKGRLRSVPRGAKTSTADGWTRVELPGFGAPLQVGLHDARSILRGAAGQGLPGDVFYARVPVDIGGGEALATGRAIFVVDTSASEASGGASRRAALLEALLSQDASVEEYAVLLFDVQARWLHGAAFRPRTPATIQQTLAELRKVSFEGATNLGAAAEALEAARGWAVDGPPTTVFLLSDGQATWGEEDPGQLVAQHPALSDVRLVAYRFDAEPSRGALLAGLARRSRGGRVVSVPRAGSAAAAADAHRLAGAQLLSVSVEGAPSADVVVDGAPASLHPGQVLTVAGRLPEGGAGTLVVRYALFGAEARLEVPLGAGGGDPLAATGWAELFVRELSDSQDPRLDRVMVAMGRRFSLANRKASFVVVEPSPPAPPGVDVSSLLQEVWRARAASRQAAEGLSVQDLAPHEQALLTALRRRSDGPARGQPLLWTPSAGGVARRRAEAEYRAARQRGASSLRAFERIARTRALAGDTAGAVRGLSTAVELSPHAPGALRAVGYALLGLGQYPAAADAFLRLRRLRPFEPQAWLEEALALEAAGRLGQAALRYEYMLSLSNQGPAARRAAAAGYAALLATVDIPEAATRRGALMKTYPAVVSARPPELAVRAFGAEVPAEVDLWVYEPDGVRCSAARPQVPDGGRLVLSRATGSGPELYEAAQARPGAYDVLVHYRRGPKHRPGVSSGVLVVVDRKGAERRFVTRLLVAEDAVLLVRTERF